jgi:hypothetical protein
MVGGEVFPYLEEFVVRRSGFEFLGCLRSSFEFGRRHGRFGFVGQGERKPEGSFGKCWLGLHDGLFFFVGSEGSKEGRGKREGG